MEWFKSYLDNWLLKFRNCYEIYSIKRDVPFYLLFRSHIGPDIQLHLFDYLHYFIKYIKFLKKKIIIRISIINQI